VGQAVQLAATLQDASGNVLTGRAVSWTSGTLGVATVSGSGLVTGVTAGTATITATSEGQNRSATVSVGSGSGSGSYPNQPAGFVTLVDQAWDAIPPYPGTAASDWWAGEMVSNAAIIRDPTAPQSAPNVLACHVPAGTYVGIGTCEMDRDDFHQGGGTYSPKLYVSVWVKHSSNWVPHPVGSKMLWFEHAAQSCSGYTDVYSTFNSATMQVGVNEQNCTGRYLLANTGDASYWTALAYRGVWQHYEFLLEMNTGSQSNGVFKLWVDGHLIADYGDVQWVPTAADVHLWSGVRYYNVYGGGPGTAADQYEYLDHLYVSGSN